MEDSYKTKRTLLASMLFLFLDGHKDIITIKRPIKKLKRPLRKLLAIEKSKDFNAHINLVHKASLLGITAYRKCYTNASKKRGKVIEGFSPFYVIWLLWNKYPDIVDSFGLDEDSLQCLHKEYQYNYFLIHSMIYVNRFIDSMVEYLQELGFKNEKFVPYKLGFDLKRKDNHGRILSCK